MDTHLCFQLRRCDIRSRILIPKLYDPELALACESVGDEYDTPRLGDLLEPGDAGSRLGDWIRREHYGTGDVPYVRTSDLAHWRIRADFKKGVSHAVFESLREKQDVRPRDILMVAHGTYLVGNVAIVGDNEGELVVQDHIFRLRMARTFGIEPELLLAALSTRFVRRQIRARQFSADIIDKLGDRHLDIRVPIPRNEIRRSRLSVEVRSIIREQDDTAYEVLELSGRQRGTLRERSESHFGFSMRRSQLQHRILVPKYYDPDIANEIREAEKRSGHWNSLSELRSRGLLDMETGVEVGKLAYGTGDIPFLRTSDITMWEVRHDAKHSVSQAIYDDCGSKGQLRAGDVILVRDGTYLVGSSALVIEDDLPAMFCGGLYRLRARRQDELDSATLLGLLNLPLVRLANAGKAIHTRRNRYTGESAT